MATMNVPVHHSGPATCEGDCGGTGYVKPDGYMACSPCSGRHHNAFPCDDCNGAGYEACSGCTVHLSDYHGTGYYAVGGKLVCSLRCARLLRLRAVWALAAARRAA